MKFYISDENNYKTTIYYIPVKKGYLGIEYKNDKFVGAFIEDSIDKKEIKILQPHIQKKYIEIIFTYYAQ
ncbi:MAG: hypothetical protein ACOCP4_07335 [Candidatus Woesearchaeota archaeon]